MLQYKPRIWFSRCYSNFGHWYRLWFLTLCHCQFQSPRLRCLFVDYELSPYIFLLYVLFCQINILCWWFNTNYLMLVLKIKNLMLIKLTCSASGFSTYFVYSDMIFNFTFKKSWKWFDKIIHLLNLLAKENVENLWTAASV